MLRDEYMNAYRDTDSGARCPHCGSPDFLLVSAGPDDGRERAPAIQCRDCGRRWEDDVQLVDAMSDTIDSDSE